MNPMHRTDMDPISGRRIVRHPSERPDPRLSPPFPELAEPECRLTMIGSLAIIMLIVVAMMGLWVAAQAIDWGAALDFIAPTAAQARDTGWAALAEGR